MKLYLSFEQEAALKDSQSNGESGLDVVLRENLRTGYVTAQDAPYEAGDIVTYLGPFKEDKAAAMVDGVANMLRKLGHEVLICGKDF